jgi:hypothetical protein
MPSRRFDHEEARAWYAMGGWTFAELGEAFGVSRASMRLACDPAYRDAHNESQRWCDRRACACCGELFSWAANGRSARCRSCTSLKSREAAHGGAINVRLEVLGALSVLPARERQVVVDHVVVGLTYPEIGRNLGISAQACQKIADKALRKLATTLASCRDAALEEVA